MPFVPARLVADRPQTPASPSSCASPTLSDLPNLPLAQAVQLPCRPGPADDDGLDQGAPLPTLLRLARPSLTLLPFSPVRSRTPSSSSPSRTRSSSPSSVRAAFVLLAPRRDFWTANLLPPILPLQTSSIPRPRAARSRQSTSSSPRRSTRRSDLSTVRPSLPSLLVVAHARETER